MSKKTVSLFVAYGALVAMAIACQATPSKSRVSLPTLSAEACKETRYDHTCRQQSNKSMYIDVYDTENCTTASGNGNCNARQW